MKKKRSTLGLVSAACIASLALAPASVRWQRAPWNRATAKPVAKWKTVQFPRQMAWTPDGKTIIAITGSKGLEAWNEIGTPIPQAVTQAWSLTPDGQTVLQLVPGPVIGRNATGAVYRNVTVKIAGVTPPRVLHRLTIGRREAPRGVVHPDLDLSRDNKHVLFRGLALATDKSLVPDEIKASWDVKTGAQDWIRIQRENAPIRGRSDSDSAHRYLPVGHFPNVAAKFKTKATVQYDRSSGELVSVLTGRPADLYKTGDAANHWVTNATPSGKITGRLAVAFNPYGMRSEGLICVWDLDTRSLLWRWEGQCAILNGPVLSPDEKRIAVAISLEAGGKQPLATTTRPTVLIFDSKTGGQLAQLDEDTPALRWRRAAKDKWDKFRLNQPVSSLHPRSTLIHLYPASAMAWSPDSRRLAVGYSDMSVKVWRCP